MYPEGRKALDPALAGVEMNVCTETVRRLIRTGQLPAVKVGRVWRIRRQDIDAFMAGSPV